MMNFVRQAIQDADVLLFLTDLFETEFPDPDILQRINDLGQPLVVAINKVSYYCNCCDASTTAVIGAIVDAAASSSTGAAVCAI
jgi:predicted GTPase